MSHYHSEDFNKTTVPELGVLIVAIFRRFLYDLLQDMHSTMLCAASTALIPAPLLYNPTDGI